MLVFVPIKTREHLLTLLSNNTYAYDYEWADFDFSKIDVNKGLFEIKNVFAGEYTIGIAYVGLVDDDSLEIFILDIAEKYRKLGYGTGVLAALMIEFNRVNIVGISAIEAEGFWGRYCTLDGCSFNISIEMLRTKLIKRYSKRKRSYILAQRFLRYNDDFSSLYYSIIRQAGHQVNDIDFVGALLERNIDSDDIREFEREPVFVRVYILMWSLAQINGAEGFKWLVMNNILLMNSKR